MSDSKDNLENFFKNRMEAGNYEYREEDWAKMEEKLNNELPVAGGITASKYFWMASGAALMAIIFFSYFGVKSILVDRTVADTSGSGQVDNSLQEKKISDQFENTIGQAKSEEIVSNNQRQEAEIHNKLTDQDQSDTNITPFVKDQSNKIRPVKKDSDLKYAANNTEASSAMADNGVVVKSFEHMKFEREVEPQNTPYEYSKSSFGWVTPEKITVEKEPVLKRVWALSLVGAADASKTPEGSLGKPQMRLGVAGEYFIADNFSLGIGANITEKNYAALGVEYTPPEGFWTRGIAPESTRAECQVLDIPVTVNYYKSITKKGSLQLQGGLSSWFMLTEHYWYKYQQSDPDLVKYWGTKNENNYWFSVINLGVNYHHQLNKKWALSIGPYVNIPLSGIGHGNVKLKSAGLKASLQFHKFKPMLR